MVSLFDLIDIVDSRNSTCSRRHAQIIDSLRWRHTQTIRSRFWDGMERNNAVTA